MSEREARMKQRFLNQKLGKRTSRTADQRKTRLAATKFIPIRPKNKG
jgi:hypothetical protein